MDVDTILFDKLVGPIALDLPGTVLSTSYGTPAYKVDKNMFVRLKEDGKTIVVLTTERDKWMKEKPGTFFITEHYENGPYMLIDLATVKKKDLQKLLLASWRLKAPKGLLKKISK
ncbi:MAG: hypothetical protein Q8941_22475 [Bacteroidota bacterium]|nr:hypothetical protein [Bacteroidota bacterium]